MPTNTSYNGFLPNYPEYRERLRAIASRLDTLSDTTQTHLADIGIIIGGHINELKALQKELFNKNKELIK